MIKPPWLSGVFPAIVTPFDVDENLNERALRELVRFLMPNVSGFVVCGTTGEFIYLSDDERRRAIEVVLDEVSHKLPVIAGTGSSGTAHTLELTQWARDAGADAALVITPYYFKPSHKGVYEHYQRLNDLDFPLILYNIPQSTGVHKKWWTSEGLAYLDNVVGIKDSSGDAPYLQALFEKLGDRVSILCGHDEIGMAALASGADGLILASANLIPEVWQRIYNAVKQGDLGKAKELQRKIQKLARIVVRTSPTQAVKEGLWMMGFDVGNSRRPIMPGGGFRREDREELRIQLENLGKLKQRRIEYRLCSGR